MRRRLKQDIIVAQVTDMSQCRMSFAGMACCYQSPCSIEAAVTKGDPVQAPIDSIG